MKKFIEVYDNVFDLDFQNQIEDSCFDLPYSFSTTSTTLTKNQPYCPIFGHVFLPTRKYSTDFFNNIAYRLSTIIKKPIIEIPQGRVWIQIPNNGMPIHPPHTDLDFPHWVCLYYVNDSDGDTIFFKDDQKTKIKSVSPKKGRIVFFDGSIYHSSSVPTKHHRIVVNINFLSNIHINKKLNV